MKKVFLYLQKTFYRRTRVYYLDEKKAEVLNSLNDLFTKQNGYFLNKDDSFINADNFKLIPTGTAQFRAMQGPFCVLRGSLQAVNDNKTKIMVSIKPHIGCGLFFIVVSFAGIIYLCRFFIETGIVSDLIWGLSILAIGVPFSIGMARVFSLAFLEDFEMYMNIKSENI